jgi:S1-C subfamily serine protease
VDGDDELRVRQGGEALSAARHLGTDLTSGLAVLAVDGLEQALEPSPGARVGQVAVSLGRTWSANLVASAGIVSAVGGPLRTGRGPSVEQVIRADVGVHPLGSGGPLLDGNGRALGIASGAWMRGIPLFLPSQLAWKIGGDLEEHGGIARGYLGISAQPVRIPERQRSRDGRDTALLVVDVAAGSPAERAGILLGDVVVAFGGQAVDDHEALLALLTPDRVGQSASLDVIRGGEPRTLEVTVGPRR